MASRVNSPGGDDAEHTPAGESLAGRYVVKRVLGEGAQKTVYLVHDQDLDRECALALIKTDLLDAEDLARLRREAQTMARLTHGNIVTVFDIGDEGGRPYVVSEYVAGGDLRQELRQEGPPPLAQSVSIAKDLCQALSVAHEQGVVHRDLKPGNIWLTKHGAAKLGDFGIAQAIDRSRLTMTGTVMGTAAYMAPEQAQGQEATPRSDLYSLGCVLYELLTGRPPFVGADPMAVVSQQVYAQPALPSKANGAVPEALERLVLRLLAKAPEGRPASADEVLAELERIEAVLPSTEMARPRGWRRLWARPAYRIALAAVVLVVIGGGVAGGIMLSQSAGRNAVEITYRYGSLAGADATQEFAPPEASGNCETEDLLLRFPPGEPGPITGQNCQLGSTSCWQD